MRVEGLAEDQARGGGSNSSSRSNQLEEGTVRVHPLSQRQRNVEEKAWG